MTPPEQATPEGRKHPVGQASRGTRPKVRVFLESRYRKLERGLPQTIFYCPDCKGNKRKKKDCGRCEGFGKLTKDSIQELLGRHILPTFKGKYGKFHGAGREDIDVLMLGRGRPFVYEVVAAKVLDVDLVELHGQISERCAGRVEFERFQRVKKERVAYWKESKFGKVYRVLVLPGGDVDPARLEALLDQPIQVLQRTPQRVAFRRADLERAREVTVRRIGSRADDGLLEVEVACAHGTYVKEWVSGDDGRTKSSLAELLGVSCVCEQLDVMEILTD